ILGAHPYGFANPPDDPRGAHGGLNFLRVLDLHDVMSANGDADKPMWITEFGYATNAPAPPAARSNPTNGAPPLGPGVSEVEQARWLPQAYEIARDQMSFVQLFTVWNLASGLPATDSQAGYSLLHGDGSPKPAFATLAAAQKQTPAASVAAGVRSVFTRPAARNSFPVLARDTIVHLGDSEYPSPWVPLYLTRNPSTVWSDQFYLTAQDLQSAVPGPWRLTMELMQVNDFDSRVLVNGDPVEPPFLPSEDFTSVWVSAAFRVPPHLLRVGRNDISLDDGKAFPAFQQPGYTWDDFQVRNVLLEAPQ
ncbi:MAG: hypothetical protein M1482_14095, partial [Chloroflexi bacterium]|nr:hypothetical protein [Chloroflexota bacterium]